MVVDDDPSHRALISEILSPLGFIVLESIDAYDCLNPVTHTPVDLFLLDISMPGMNGWELLEVLRKQGVKEPVIMVSADAIENQELAQQDHAEIRLNDDYLVKPIRDYSLLDKVAKALNLEWRYEADLTPQNSPATVIQTTPDDDFFNGVSDNDCRELKSMAELGYVAGLEEILNRLEQRGDAELFINSIRHFARRYQFSKIISMLDKVIRS